MFAGMIERTNAWGAAWAAWMGASILDAVVVLALAGLLWLTLRRRASIQLGYCLFLLVLVKLFVPLEVAVPERVTRWMPARLLQDAWTASDVSRAVAPAAPALDAEQPAMVAPRFLVPDHEHDASRVAADTMPETNAAKERVSDAGAPLDAVAPAAETRRDLSIWAGLMIAWAGVASLLLLRFARAQWRFHRRLREAKKVDLSGLGVDFAELCRRVGLRRQVNVVESPAMASPAVWGLRRPVLILPEGLVGSVSGKPLEWILLHELAHVRRHDLAVACFQRLAMILHFVNPAVWVANRMVNRLREYACDDAALAAGGGTPLESGEAFMWVVRRAAQRRLALGASMDGALGVFDSDARTTCFQRMARLLDDNRRLRVRLGFGSLCLLIVMAAITLPQLRAADEKKPDAPAAATTASDKPTTSPAKDSKDATATAQTIGELVISDAETSIGNATIVPQTTSGTTTIEALGRFEVLVSTSGGEAAKKPDAKPSPQATADKPAAPAAAPYFTLTVVGPDGKGIANAQVHAAMAPWSKKLTWTATSGKVIESAGNGATMATGPDGRLVFRLSDKKLDWLTCIIRTDGYGPFMAHWQGGDSGKTIPAGYTAHLDAARSVGGIVVDEEGKPIAGVVVDPSVDYKRPDSERGAAGGFVSAGGRNPDPTTDAEGKWIYHSVPVAANEFGVSIDHPGYTSQSVVCKTKEYALDGGKTPTAKIVLTRGLTLTGKVTDEAGAIVAGANVQANFSKGNLGLYQGSRDATTGADGVYQLLGCPSGRADIFAQATGRGPDVKKVEVKSGMSPVDFKLPPGRTLRVRVTDPSGKPLERAVIQIESWRGYGNMQLMGLPAGRSLTDKEGLWTWNEAPADPVTIGIWPKEAMIIRGQSVVARDKEYVFKVSPALVISGRVIDAKTKQPIAKVRVTPGFHERGDRLYWDRRNAFEATGGTYRVKQTEPRPGHLVRVEADGYRPGVSRDINNDEGNVTVDFELEPGKETRCRVLKPDGGPAARAEAALAAFGAGAYVHNSAFYDEMMSADRLTADAEGNLVIPPQATPFQLIVLHPSGCARVEGNLDAPPESVHLQPWARVEGTLRVGAKPAAGVQLVLNSMGAMFTGKTPDANSVNYAKTDKNGHFRFDRVAAGAAAIGGTTQLHFWQGTDGAASSRVVRIDAKPGETLRVDLGGSGRPVVGRLVAPKDLGAEADWSFCLVQLVPKFVAQQPDVMPSGISNDPPRAAAWWARWEETEQGRAWQMQNDPQHLLGSALIARVRPDGSFRIEDVPAGEHELVVRLQAASNGYVLGPLPPTLATLRREVTIPPMEGGRSDEPLELGTLTLEKSTVTAP